MKILFLFIFFSIASVVFSQNKDKNKNRKYLEENSGGIANEEFLQKEIIKILSTKEFSYRIIDPDTYPIYSEHYGQIFSLSIDQDKVIYLMLMRLKDPNFLKAVGEIIQKDVADKFSEAGGIIRFKNGKIYLKTSKSQIQSDKGNNYYLISDKEDSLLKISYFHLHATTFYEAKFAGPSNLDILITEAHLMDYDSVNEFVITSIGVGKFNIDYDGVDLRSHLKKPDKAVVIDLGNYNY